MRKIISQIIKEKKIVNISDELTEILTETEYQPNIKVKIFIKKTGGKFYLTDNKNTLRFMSRKYELKAPDVKQCINDIVKYYGFAINKGEILSELSPGDNCNKRYNDLLICSCTLANMFIFFESPN